MARNEEKAQSMLNRWLAYKRDDREGAPKKQPYQKRPALASECTTIGDCERWRMQIVREIGKKIMEIQNESLGEQRIRDLNDDINKSLREKGHWERRIIDLGGPNYRKFERIVDDQLLSEQDPTLGTEQKGFTYKYFGAARKLPGVKELFLKKEDPKAKRRRFDTRGLDADYYGYRDDEDGILETLEQEAEKKALASISGTESKDSDSSVELGNNDYIAHVPVPTKQQMEKLLVDKRKQDLLKKYVSKQLLSDLDQQKKEVEVVLGKRKH